MCRHGPVPRPPEVLGEERDVHAVDLAQLVPGERIVLERVLARVAEIDRGADPVSHEGRTPVRGEAAQVVAAHDGVTTGGVSVARGEATEVPDDQARVPLELAQIGVHERSSGRMRPAIFAPPSAERTVLFFRADRLTLGGVPTTSGNL